MKSISQYCTHTHLYGLRAFYVYTFVRVKNFVLSNNIKLHKQFYLPQLLFSTSVSIEIRWKRTWKQTWNLTRFAAPITILQRIRYCWKSDVHRSSIGLPEHPFYCGIAGRKETVLRSVYIIFCTVVRCGRGIRRNSDRLIIKKLCFL